MANLFSTCSLIKAPLRETLQFVSYHLQAGANPMFLFFDDPNDEVADVVTQIPGVVVTRCDEKFWTGTRKLAPQDIASANLDGLSMRQRLASVAAVRMARERQCEWLIQIDSDELLFPQFALKDLFRNIPANITTVRFPPLEAIPVFRPESGAFLDTQLFKSGQRGLPPKELTPGWDGLLEKLSYNFNLFSFRLKRSLATLLGLRRLFRNSYFLGHTQGKSATRLSSGVQYLDPHYPKSQENRLQVKTVETVKLVHYDCQGFDAWSKKWERRVLTSYRPRNKKRIEQFDAFKALYERQDQQGLETQFNELYQLSRNEERILSVLGLIVKIKMQPEYFDSEAPDNNSAEALAIGKHGSMDS